MKALFPSLLLALALVTPRAQAVSPDLLTVGINAEFDNLNPVVSSTGAAKYMLYLAWRPLVVLNLDNKWAPTYIKAIPTIENKLAKKKGESIIATIELLDKAQWGDGTPLTCKDVEFGWRVGKNKNVSVIDREMFDNVTSVTWDAGTPKKCVVTFATSKYDFFYNLPYPLPAHIEEPVFEKFQDKAEGYERNSTYTTNPTNPALYMGPYVISDVKLGDHVTFTANPKWWGKKPTFKKIVFKFIPNQGTLVANLRSGNIDMLTPPAGLAMDQAVEFSNTVKKENLPFNVIFQDGLVFAQLEVNFDHPALGDVRVRRALAESFSKDEIIKGFLSGKGKPAMSFVTQDDPWFTKQTPSYKYDRRDAQKLLDEAGWKVGPTGTREKDGKRLAITLGSLAGSKVNEMIEAYLQAQFKAIGIELSIKNLPARVFFGETIKHRDFDLAMFAWMSVPENPPHTIFGSKEIPSEKNAYAGQNFSGYKSAEMDKLLEQLQRELNATKRAAIGQKISILYGKDLPSIPVYFRPTNAVVPKVMKNYRASGHMFYETLYGEDWSL